LSWKEGKGNLCNPFESDTSNTHMITDAMLPKKGKGSQHQKSLWFF